MNDTRKQGQNDALSVTTAFHQAVGGDEQAKERLITELMYGLQRLARGTVLRQDALDGASEVAAYEAVGAVLRRAVSDEAFCSRVGKNRQSIWNCLHWYVVRRARNQLRFDRRAKKGETESALAGGASPDSENSVFGIEHAAVADVSEPVEQLLAADEQTMFVEFLKSLQYKPLQVAANRLFIVEPTDNEKTDQQEMFWLLFERTIARAHRELMSDSTLSSGRSWQAPAGDDRKPGKLSEQQLPQLMEQLIEVLKYIPLRDFASLLDKQYQWLCGELTEDRTRLVLDRNLEGDTVEEISAKIKRAKKSVQRELKTIRQRLGFT